MKISKCDNPLMTEQKQTVIAETYDYTIRPYGQGKRRKKHQKHCHFCNLCYFSIDKPLINRENTK